MVSTGEYAGRRETDRASWVSRLPRAGEGCIRSAGGGTTLPGECRGGHSEKRSGVWRTARNFGTFDLVAGLTDGVDTGRVARFFLRIVEQPDGAWCFRRGRENVKGFANLDDAVEHATNIASEIRPSEVFVHRLDGRVQVIATFD
jgi:hypothetical protein